MRYLIISDIHANWEALAAVLSSAEGQYDSILCLGDLVGYGPDPNRVVEWARDHVTTVVRGNHDRACANLDYMQEFSPLAKKSTRWTHETLSRENTDYLRELPPGPYMNNGFALVHGSPRDEDEYLVNSDEAAGAFPFIQARLTFFGHTHLQWGFEASQGRVSRLKTLTHPIDLSYEPEVDYLVNPGSVGQPRDLNPLAAYVLFDPDNRVVVFQRVPYPVVDTQRKIRDAGLPSLLADRLAIGK